MQIPSPSLGAGAGGYTHLLPMAWMVPTFHATRPGASIPQSGAPLIQLQDPDLQARAQRLVNVLFWTAQNYSNHPGMQDARTLKVFIAPEFYFRKAAKEDAQEPTGFGAYPEHARYMLAEALYGAILDSPLFKDWTIFAGSICSALPQAGSRPRDLLNTGIVMRGARTTSDASVPYVLVDKRYLSNLDEQAAQRSVDSSIPYAFRQAPGQDLDNLIHWDGMTLGVELGLDHGIQSTVNAMGEVSRVMGPDVPGPALQLVASCGMSIVDQGVAVRAGGLVFLVDGHSSIPRRLAEPRFRIGRFDAATATVAPLGEDRFRLTQLPAGDDYCVDYAQGRYAAAGRRQGVWSSLDRIPL